MDILYILGSNSCSNNDEIRLSLRSIEANCSGIDRVFVCGTNPGFLSKNVVFIPCIDPFYRKHKNITYKIDYAIKHSNIGMKFLIMSDDQFYLRKVDFNNYPLFQKGELDTSSDGSAYHQSLYEARQILESFGLSTLKTNLHCAKPVSRDAWDAIYEMRAKANNLECGAEINCLLGNYYILKGVQPVECLDTKLKKYEGTPEPTETGCVSCSNTAFLGGLRDYLFKLFPNKSKYEL